MSLPERTRWPDAAALWGQASPPAALAALCDALDAVAPRLHFLGKQRIRQRLVEALASHRQRIRAFADEPALAERALPRPIVIVGPFRSGTTFLHRLLSEDSRLRWLRPWESMYAARGGGSDYLQDDERIALLERDLRHLYRHQPALAQLHPVAPHEAEECFGVLEASFSSPSFLFLAPVESYLDHLAHADEAAWSLAYAEYADQLRLVDARHGGERWLLKSPVHLWNLAALTRALPGALLVHTHREPAAAVLSLCRLIHAHHGLAMAAPDPLEAGRSAWRFYAAALPRAVAARRAGGRHLDLAFDAISRDPLAAVREVLAAAGLAPPSAETEARVRRRGATPAPSAPADTRDLASFGLRAADVRSLFDDYAAFAP